MLALFFTLATPVVGGADATAGEWDAVAYLSWETRETDPETGESVTGVSGCTGVLVAPDAVLTAAHCVTDAPMRVHLGTTHPEDDAGELHEVLSALRHPSWDGHHGIDLAVVRLSTRSAFTPHAVATPACAASRGLVDDAMAMIVGFGSRYRDAHYDGALLQEAPIQIADADCSDEEWDDGCDHLGGELVGDGSMLGTSTCNGDSGGPLYPGDGTPVVLGITSRGPILDADNQCIGPAVYVRPDAYIDWIAQMVGSDLATDDCTEGGGCSAGTGSMSSLLGLVVLALVGGRRRRHAVAAAIATGVVIGGASLAVAGARAPIVGGTEVTMGVYPDIVAVTTRVGECTGTLIAPDLVLTATHCLETFEDHQVPDPQLPTITFGVIDRAAAGTTVEVTKAIEHPTLDVAVLELASPVSFTPRELASGCAASSVDPDAETTAVGFGATSGDFSDSNTKLHEAVLPIVDLDCAEPARWEHACRTGNSVVVSSPTSSACFGDSGGPLLVDAGHGMYLLGVASKGLFEDSDNPCTPGSQVIYERVDQLGTWIETQTGRDLPEVTCDEPSSGGCTAAPGAAGLAWFAVLVPLGFVATRRRYSVRRNR